MKIRILTIIFGLFWLIFGLNNFLHFFPIPEPSAEGKAFMDALAQAGYVLPLVYGTQILVGALLIIGRFVPLALLMLAPITANIMLYDVFLNPSGLVIGAIIAGIHAILFYANRQVLFPLLKP